VVDDRVVLLGVAGPVDVGPEPGRVGLELLEVPVQVRERVLLDLRGQLAQLLPLRHAGDRLVAVLAHPPDQAVVGGLVQLEGDEPRRQPFGINRTGHSTSPFDVTPDSCPLPSDFCPLTPDPCSTGPPLRIWAMWMTFIGSLRRSMTPFMCSRHDM